MLKMKQDTPVRLPNEYQEVEYIESTGTQCIDTGIPLNQYRKCEMEFSPTSIGTTQIIDGGYTNTSEQDDTRNYLRIDSDGMLNLQYARSNTSYKLSSVVIASNTKYAISYKMLASSCSLTVNGTEYSNLIGVTLITNGNNVFLFGESFKDKNSTKTYEASAFIKLYTAKYYDSNDILIRNFIPCYRKLDNEIGLYDLINNQFYTNAGTGVFTMGAIIGSEDINLNPVLNNKKIMKIYKGNTLKYYRRIQFYKCPFPTSWTKSETSQTGYPPIYISTNDYGQWTIESSAVASGVGNPDVHYAFDNDKNTHFMSSGLAESNSIAYIEIDSPIDICPRVFYIIVEKINGFTIQGFNENNEWEDITSISGQIGNKTEKTVEVQTSKYHTKFKVNMKRYSSSKKYPYVYEFQIISGTFKK